MLTHKTSQASEDKFFWPVSLYRESTDIFGGWFIFRVHELDFQKTEIYAFP